MNECAHLKNPLKDIKKRGWKNMFLFQTFLSQIKFLLFVWRQLKSNNTVMRKNSCRFTKDV